MAARPPTARGRRAGEAATKQARRRAARPFSHYAPPRCSTPLPAGAHRCDTGREHLTCRPRDREGVLPAPRGAPPAVYGGNTAAVFRGVAGVHGGSTDVCGINAAINGINAAINGS
eukprot:3667303-Rhodomonas_salina.1